MNPFKTELAEIEKGCEQELNDGFETYKLNCKAGNNELCFLCKSKRDELIKCQEIHEKIMKEFVEKLRKKVQEETINDDGNLDYKCGGIVIKIIDKLYEEMK